jgi:hypothetical protein
LIVILLAMSGVGISRVDANTPHWMSCLQLFDENRPSEAITACNAADGDFAGTITKVNEIFHSKSEVSPDQEKYALQQGQALFVVAFTKARLLARYNDATRAHECVLDAATWAILMTSLLQQNDPTHSSPLFQHWKPIVGSLLKAVEAFSPGILLQVPLSRGRY